MKLYHLQKIIHWISIFLPRNQIAKLYSYVKIESKLHMM